MSAACACHECERVLVGLQRLVQSMDAAGVSVLALPTWSNLPLRIGDFGSPSGEFAVAQPPPVPQNIIAQKLTCWPTAGNNAYQISPPTGAPAMAVPMGFAATSQSAPPLPASLQLIARPFDEASLIRAGYAYEQATLHRRHATPHPCHSCMLPLSSHFCCSSRVFRLLPC